MSKSWNDISPKVVVWGFLRDILDDEHDYNDIILIIYAYRKQGFAQYYDESKDKDYKHQMRFGDILKTNNDKYMVLNINNALERVGDFYTEPCSEDDGSGDDNDEEIYIEIPLSICKRLDNAIAFYANLNKIKSFQDAEYFHLELKVKHNDEWIINHFNGPLNCNYNEIRVVFVRFSAGEQKLNRGVMISFCNYKRTFYPIGNKLNNKDVDMFFEIRKDKNNLVKVRYQAYDYAYDSNLKELNMFDVFQQGFYLWEKTRIQMDGHEFIDFVGPKTEQNKMVDRLKFISKNETLEQRLSFIELNKIDYISRRYVAI